VSRGQPAKDNADNPVDLVHSSPGPPPRTDAKLRPAAGRARSIVALGRAHGSTCLDETGVVGPGARALSRDRVPHALSLNSALPPSNMRPATLVQRVRGSGSEWHR
jgi:hypothetical protein